MKRRAEKKAAKKALKNKRAASGGSERVLTFAGSAVYNDPKGSAGHTMQQGNGDGAAMRSLPSFHVSVGSK